MVEDGLAVGLLMVVELKPVEGLHDHDSPLPPVSFNCTGASFTHFVDGPEIEANEGFTVMVTTLDVSNEVFCEQATASL